MKERPPQGLLRWIKVRQSSALAYQAAQRLQWSGSSFSSTRPVSRSVEKYVKSIAAIVLVENRVGRVLGGCCAGSETRWRVRLWMV